MALRHAISDFSFANTAYAGATVTFYDANGNIATLYSDMTDDLKLKNPQILSNNGTFINVPYTEVPVVATINLYGININVKTNPPPDTIPPSPDTIPPLSDGEWIVFINQDGGLWDGALTIPENVDIGDWGTAQTNLSVKISSNPYTFGIANEYTQWSAQGECMCPVKTETPIKPYELDSNSKHIPNSVPYDSSSQKTPAEIIDLVRAGDYTDSSPISYPTLHLDLGWGNNIRGGIDGRLNEFIQTQMAEWNNFITIQSNTLTALEAATPDIELEQLPALYDPFEIEFSAAIEPLIAEALLNPGAIRTGDYVDWSELIGTMLAGNGLVSSPNIETSRWGNFSTITVTNTMLGGYDIKRHWDVYFARINSLVPVSGWGQLGYRYFGGSSPVIPKFRGLTKSDAIAKMLAYSWPPFSAYGLDYTFREITHYPPTDLYSVWYNNNIGGYSDVYYYDGPTGHWVTDNYPTRGWIEENDFKYYIGKTTTRYLYGSVADPAPTRISTLTADQHKLEWTSAAPRVSSVFLSKPNENVNYDTKTSDFTVGANLTGATSKARGVISGDTNLGTSGTLNIRDMLGSFLAGEVISDSVVGSAICRTDITPTTPSKQLLSFVDNFINNIY